MVKSVFINAHIFGWNNATLIEYYYYLFLPAYITWVIFLQNTTKVPSM